MGPTHDSIITLRVEASSVAPGRAALAAESVRVMGGVELGVHCRRDLGARKDRRLEVTTGQIIVQ